MTNKVDFLTFIDCFGYLQTNVLATIDIAIAKENAAMLQALRGVRNMREMYEHSERVKLLNELRDDIQKYLGEEWEKVYDKYHSTC